MPLVRYRTGDIFKVTGDVGAEKFHFKGRERDAIMVGNSALLTEDIDKLVSSSRVDWLVYQLQIKNNKCVIHYVRAAGEADNAEIEKLSIELSKQTRFETTALNVQVIAPEKSGKFSIIKKL